MSNESVVEKSEAVRVVDEEPSEVGQADASGLVPGRSKAVDRIFRGQELRQAAERLGTPVLAI